MEPAFRTRVTDLFEIRHPILVGGMMWLSTAEFVAACGRAGALAFMTPRSYESPAGFREGLARAIDLADGAPIGVNLTIPRHTDDIPTADYLAISLDLGVSRFETAGSRPGDLIAAIKAGGGKVVHKCTRPRHAASAQQDGADAVALVGMEAGGHPGTNPHPAHILAAEALPQLKAPLVLGGGIGTGGQILAALAQGAEAVVIGSRLLTSAEIWAHPSYKQKLISSGIDDTTTALARYGVTWRVLDNETAREVQEMERRPEIAFGDFGERVRGTFGRDNAYVRGVWQKGMLSCSAGVAFSRRVQPAGEIIEELMREAEVAMVSLTGKSLRAKEDPPVDFLTDEALGR
ncbi:MAG: NAD(P)H-dependent flavin oxidoreductase [Salinarimonas sp.]